MDNYSKKSQSSSSTSKANRWTSTITIQAAITSMLSKPWSTMQTEAFQGRTPTSSLWRVQLKQRTTITMVWIQPKRLLRWRCSCRLQVLQETTAISRLHPICHRTWAAWPGQSKETAHIWGIRARKNIQLESWRVRKNSGRRRTKVPIKYMSYRGGLSRSQTSTESNARSKSRDYTNPPKKTRTKTS